MKGFVLCRPRARQDLIDIFRYLARDRGIQIAHRFFVQVESTLQRLADIPGLGAPYEAENPAFPRIRFLSVNRFRKYLIFYIPITGGIDVVRVLHGSRDIPRILARDFGIEGAEDNLVD
jgi:toxin ParE1/3/4